ncbi:RloB family protein [Methylovulum miyakonense]|uniref:RloB family protein n=1 Tax=Methylovulum miyakonense TaxID=645578 RepID=UPI00037EB6F4|nr:RloB family protein [Methylovulum miyakonense]
MPKPRKGRSEQQLKPLLRIYCEGAKTEPNYIQGYLDKFFPTNRRLKVVKIEDTKKNTPKELVGVAVNAKKLANKTGLSDLFWVVYDRESQQKYSDALHHNAYDTAQKHNVSVALSNVCFEIWLILHLEDTTAPYSCYDDLRSNSSLRKHLKIRGIQDYDKGAEDIFNFFSEEEIKNARDRAYRMNIQTQQSANSSQTKPYQLNPYTDVYKLLDAIDEIALKGN